MTLDFLKEKLLPKEIAKKRSLKTNTIISHIEELFEGREIEEKDLKYIWKEIEKKYINLKQDISDKADKYEEKKNELLLELKEYVNSHVNRFSRINTIILQPVPFEKTATLKINPHCSFQGGKFCK